MVNSPDRFVHTGSNTVAIPANISIILLRECTGCRDRGLRKIDGLSRRLKINRII